MNDNQNKNSNKNSNQNKNKKNFNGLLMLLGWAVVLTVVFNYLAAYSQQADTASSTHEISYSEFLELVERATWQRSSSPTVCWRSPRWRAMSTPTRTAGPTATT